jgi:hypothetical protein
MLYFSRVMFEVFINFSIVSNLGYKKGGLSVNSII